MGPGWGSLAQGAQSVWGLQIPTPPGSKGGWHRLPTTCPPPQHCAMPRGPPCTDQVPSAGPDPGGPSQEDLQVLAVTRCHRGAAFWALLRCPGLLCAGREAVLRPFPQPQGAGESQPRSQHPAGSPAAHLHPLPSERMHPANIHKRHLRGCRRWVVLGGRRCWRLAKGYLGVEGEGPC